ncbi:hypothetical protein P7H19_08630 [Paenibacillus larvae]|nr:hypothetical protein [Paenibacillus larvae]MDT2236339.1 hypothetical protein [Paenibacillus larvae]
MKNVKGRWNKKHCIRKRFRFTFSYGTRVNVGERKPVFYQNKDIINMSESGIPLPLGTATGYI